MTDPRDLHEIVAELRRLCEAAPLPLHQQESHLTGKDITLKRSHRLLGSASTMQGLGLIFGDDDGLARLIVLAINALPRLLDAVERAAKMEGEIDQLIDALSACAAKNDLSGVSDDLIESAACCLLHDVELTARQAISDHESRRALGGTDGTT